jgi:hypothetical protein
MEDVLRVYERPYNPAEPVACLDEKPVTLRADVRPPVAAAPGKVAKRDNEYKRCGTANVFCAVEPTRGRHFLRATPYRSAPEFARAAEEIIRAYPFARRIHLVTDNLNTHRRKSLTDYFGPKQGRYPWNRLKVSYTPKPAVGSTKRKSRSVCSPGSAWGGVAFPAWKRCGGSRGPGVAG